MRKKHKMHKRDDHGFVLHIDAEPLLFKSAAPRSPTNRRRGKVSAFIWDKVQFVFVSLVVFAVIYAVINWQALHTNAVHYWNVWRGVQSPLEKLVAQEPVFEEKLIDPDIGEANALLDVPPLNIEVFPPDMRIVIPRINQNVPVIGVKNENLISRKWDELEADIQGALRGGVVHYPGTALPGENGNVVITGHSSYYPWAPGRFKDVFALLHDVQVGDKIVVYFNQRKFIYEASEIRIVSPKDIDVLAPANSEQLTLITCTPMGTNLKRLIVTARLIEKN